MEALEIDFNRSCNFHKNWWSGIFFGNLWVMLKEKAEKHGCIEMAFIWSFLYDYIFLVVESYPIMFI